MASNANGLTAGERGRALWGTAGAQLLTVAAHYAALRQRLGGFCGACPLCGEDEFLVRPADGVCECLSCDRLNGPRDVLGLIQAVEGIDAKRARDRLRRRCWLPKAAIVYLSRPVASRKKPARKPRLKQICGARNRLGTPCQCKQLFRGGRCRYHGGLSTGPRTPAGKARAFQNLTSWKASQGVRDHAGLVTRAKAEAAK